MNEKLKLLFMKRVLEGLHIIVWHHLQNMKDGPTKEGQQEYTRENYMTVRQIDHELNKLKN